MFVAPPLLLSTSLSRARSCILSTLRALRRSSSSAATRTTASSVVCGACNLESLRLLQRVFLRYRWRMGKRGCERRVRERKAHVAPYSGEEAYSAFLDKFVGMSLTSLGDDGLWEDSGDELDRGWDDGGGGFDSWGSDG